VAVVVSMDSAGLPKSAKAEGRIERSVADVWKVIDDVNSYPDRIPMMSRVRLAGERATVDLKFKVALFSVGFQFVVDITREREKSLALGWVSGEPRGIKLRFELEPLDGGAACRLRTSGEFDPNSLGWLTKYFLKHHPEIQYGVMPGVAVALFASMRAAAEG
jgi:ribosome-associated toxin RatA of RatAB toxin-antitoxin module